MTGIHVRPIRPDEYDRVGAMVVSAYDVVGQFDDHYRSFLARPARWVPGSTEVLVAVDDHDVPIGCVAWVLPGDAEFEGTNPPAGDAGFRFLAVAPEAQGSGAGAALVTAVLERSRERGCRRIAIHSMDFMTGAHRLYERMGFQRRPDLDVVFPAGPGYAFTLDLVDDADRHFAPPGPVPDEIPWFEDAWGITRVADRSPIC